MFRTRHLGLLPSVALALLTAASGVLATEPTAPPATPPPAELETPTPAPTATPAPTPDPAATPDPTATPAPGPSVAPASPTPPAVPGATRDDIAVPRPAALTERVIVILRPGADAVAAAGRARTMGARVERTFRNAVSAYAASVSPAQALRLAADPRVAAIVPDERITGPDVLAAQGVPTGVARISGLKSAAARIDGIDNRVDADVAIYDTGIDPAHYELVVAGGYNCTSSNRADWIDEEGHGTHVAGTVGARDNGYGVVGVAPGVRLWAVRILDEKGEGYLSWWLCGLDWIAAQKDPANPSRPLIEAVNMSVTRSGRDDGACGHTNDDLLHQAICRVVAKGITVVAAAANDSGNASKRVPAAYNEVITVSALADTDGKPGGVGGNLCWSWGGYDIDDTFADFSNYGADVDLIAPGKCIKSTMLGPTYGYSSGTSMAAPHVTGAVALYRATRPEATPSDVRTALRYLGNKGWKTWTDPDGVPDILLDTSRIGPLGDFNPAPVMPTGGLVVDEAGATLAVPLAAGRGTNFIEPITFAVETVAGPLRAVLTGPTTLFGAASTATVTVTVPPATRSGTYAVVVRAAYRTTRIHHVTVRVVVVNEPPVTSPPTERLVAGLRATLASAPVRLAWSPAVDASPIGAYHVGLAGPAGTKAILATPPTKRWTDRSIPFGTPARFAVRAVDVAGNMGAWAIGDPVAVGVTQEAQAVVGRSSGWTGYASARSLGGRAMSTTRAGAWVRITFNGSGIALVGPRGPTRGSAEIWLDGVKVRNVSAYAAASGTLWLLDALAVTSARTHTLEVRVRGTAGHPRFDVDAFLVLR